MFETIVLLMGALPFIIGLYALRRIKNGNDEGPDDQPPPPDPEPPKPVLPPSPRLCRVDESLRAKDRGPLTGRSDRVRRRTTAPLRQPRFPITSHRASCSTH
jgi:hypothetical protein